MRVALWCKHGSCLHPAKFRCYCSAISAMFCSSKTHCKSLVLTGKCQEIPDKPPETWLWCSSIRLLLLRGGLHSVHVAEAMSGPILLQSGTSPQKCSSICAVSHPLYFRAHRLPRLHVGRGRRLHSSVCLGGLVARQLAHVLLSPLLDPFSLDCLSRSCRRAPTVFLTPRAFHSGVLGLLRDSDPW